MVGYTRFNEKYLDYKKRSYKKNLSTFIHEVMHALFFHPSLFKYVFPDNQGQPFLFEDTDGYFKIRGPNILQQIRSHYNCPTVNGGNMLGKFNLKHHWKMEEVEDLQEVILKS